MTATDPQALQEALDAALGVDEQTRRDNHAGRLSSAQRRRVLFAPAATGIGLGLIATLAAALGDPFIRWLSLIHFGVAALWTFLFVVPAARDAIDARAVSFEGELFIEHGSRGACFLTVGATRIAIPPSVHDAFGIESRRSATKTGCTVALGSPRTRRACSPSTACGADDLGVSRAFGAAGGSNSPNPPTRRSPSLAFSRAPGVCFADPR
jgi:hypothetical protein